MENKSECQCAACKIKPHFSDCAVHNEPAERNGDCTCDKTVRPEALEWEKEFRKVWRCQHSDCGGGGICQQKRIIEIFKPLIESVRSATLEEARKTIDVETLDRIQTNARNAALEEAAEDCLKNKITCPCAGYCVQDGRNEGIEESAATIRSLMKE